MVVKKKGILTCKLTFSWAILCIGYLLLTSLSASSASQSESDEEKKDSAPEVVQSKEKSLEECAQTCAKETRLECKFFKYHSGSESCIMASTNQQHMQPLADRSDMDSMDTDTEETSKTTDGVSTDHSYAEPEIGGKRISRWIKDLNNKVAELEDQDTDIENLKNAIIDIREQLKLMRKKHATDAHRARVSKQSQNEAYSQMTRKLVAMKVDGMKFKSAVHALSNMQRLLAKDIGGLKEQQKDVLMKISELERSNVDLDSVVSSLKATDTALQQELEAVKDGTNSLTAAFNKLQKRMNQELANKQMPPGMVKLKRNQGTLATALESVMDKVSGLMGQLPYLEEELRGTNQKIADQSSYEQDLRSKLKMLFEDLIEVKKSVHNILDPRSSVNMQQAKGMLKLKSDVSMLTEMDKGLKNDLLNQREDLAHLIKDVARLEVLAQHLRDKLTLVLSASRQFHKDIANVKQQQKDALSVVEVAQMQKQVLKALNKLKTREAILLKQLSQYRGAVKKLADQVDKSVDKKDHTQDTVTKLQGRLSHFEKEIQLLFAKTNGLTLKLQKPQTPKGLDKVIRTQTETADKVEDLVKQLQSVRKTVSLLNIDLQQTKMEEEEERKEMKNDVAEREEEMKKKQEEMKKEAIKQKQEEERALEIRKNQLMKKHQLKKQQFQHELKMEQRRRKLEEEKSKRLEELLEKRQRKFEEGEKTGEKSSKGGLEETQDRQMKALTKKLKNFVAQKTQNNFPYSVHLSEVQKVRGKERVPVHEREKFAQQKTTKPDNIEQMREQGKGNNRLRGQGVGNKKLRGQGKGNKRLRGQGNKKLRGRGKGNKRLRGQGKGNKRLRGQGKGNKRLRGQGKGNKKLRGQGAGNKKLRGRAKGNKKLRGQGVGNKKLRGRGKGNKKLRGRGKGNKKLRGQGKGNKRLRGQGKGNKRLRGQGKGNKRLRGQGKGNKRLRGQGKGNKKLRGQGVGNKKLRGRGKGNKKLRGQGVGNKKLRGRGKGNKKLRGRGKGNKRLRGQGKGNNRLRGQGKGNKRLRGQGNKRLRGKGNKRLRGQGKGNKRLKRQGVGNKGRKQSTQTRINTKRKYEED